MNTDISPMDKRNLFWWILLIILICVPLDCYSQKIENVVSEISENTIHIYYDLLGIADDQPVIVRIYVSTDGGQSYSEPLKMVKGDVGVVFGTGERKHIVWNVFEEVEELVSESVKFKVKADLLLPDQEKRLMVPRYIVNVNANIGSKVDLKSYGFNMKMAIHLKQLGLGIRGGYYKTYGEHPDIPDFGYYVGFSGGAIIDYDLIKDPKYSIYPFFYVGQIKVQHKSETITDKYVGYSIFYTPGLGLDIRVAKCVSLGVEMEYYMAAVVDINDQGGSGVVERVVIDGFCIGIALTIALNPVKE